MGLLIVLILRSIQAENKYLICLQSDWFTIIVQS